MQWTGQDHPLDDESKELEIVTPLTYAVLARSTGTNGILPPSPPSSRSRWRRDYIKLQKMSGANEPRQNQEAKDQTLTMMTRKEKVARALELVKVLPMDAAEGGMMLRTLNQGAKILVAIAVGSKIENEIHTAGCLLGSQMPNSDFSGLLMMEMECGQTEEWAEGINGILVADILKGPPWWLEDEGVLRMIEGVEVDDVYTAHGNEFLRKTDRLGRGSVLWRVVQSIAISFWMRSGIMDEEVWAGIRDPEGSQEAAKKAEREGADEEPSLE